MRPLEAPSLVQENYSWEEFAEEQYDRRLGDHMEKFKLGQYSIELVDNPYETLSSKEKELIIRESIPFTRRAFRHEGVTDSDVIIHALEVSTGVYLRNASGRIIAFAGCVPEIVSGQTIIHLKGVSLSPEYQGVGLYSILISMRLLREAEKHKVGSLLVGTRTQSPIVYYSMSVHLGLYPKPDAPVPDFLKPIANQYAELIQRKHSDFHPRRGVDFDQDNLVIRRAYGGVNNNNEEYGMSMYGDHIPWLKNNENVNKYVRNKLDLQNGDAFLLIGPFLEENCLRMLRRAEGRLNPDKLSVAERFSK